jgi:Calcineurin-like phosphoesterase
LGSGKHRVSSRGDFSIRGRQARRFAAWKNWLMTVQGYDLVGDIHGHADALHRLLRALDYTEIEGVFRHPEKQMIFVGDFIDRGPQQREVLRIARSMCEAGAAKAVMGNHEFNAIGWAAQNKDGRFLRIRKKMRASTQNSYTKSKKTPPTTKMPSVGLGVCQSG